MRTLKKKSKKSRFNQLWGKIRFNVGIEKLEHLENTCGDGHAITIGVYKAQKENLQKVVTNLDTQAEIRNHLKERETSWRLLVMT